MLNYLSKLFLSHVSNATTSTRYYIKKNCMPKCHSYVSPKLPPTERNGIDFHYLRLFHRVNSHFYGLKVRGRHQNFRPKLKKKGGSCRPPQRGFANRRGRGDLHRFAAAGWTHIISKSLSEIPKKILNLFGVPLISEWKFRNSHRGIGLSQKHTIPKTNYKKWM